MARELTLLERWQMGFGGPPPRGTWHKNAKLSPSDVREARLLHKKGWGYKRLGKRYGVSHMTMKAALTGQTWRTVAEHSNASERALAEQEAEYQEARAKRRAHILKHHLDLERALENLRAR